MIVFQRHIALANGAQMLDQYLGQCGFERTEALARKLRAYRIGGRAGQCSIDPDQILRLGSSFQTGTLNYKAETIFGVRTIQAKALISNGEVVRWIWPKSGMEIR